MTPVRSKVLHIKTPVPIALLACLLFACGGAGNCQQTQGPLAEARAQLASGQLAKAEATLKHHITENPGSADAYFLLGYVLFREEKAVDSLAAFTAGARVRPPKADELKTVASDYVLLGDYADADKWFTKVVSEKPEDPVAWYLLGRTKYNENAFASAATSFQRALALRPKYIEAENNLGLALQGMNDVEKAKASFQAAIDWQGDTPVDAQPFLNLGTLLVDQSSLELAIPYLNKAAALSPNNPKIHEELAQAYESNNDLTNAQIEFERAVYLAPTVSGLHFKLGQVYRHAGRKEKAQHEFELCEKLNSTHSSSMTPNPPISRTPAKGDPPAKQ